MNCKIPFSPFIAICILLFFSENIYCEEWKRVYLATFPRSGNHWTRYLIEEATGVATSSVYCDADPPHLRKLFPWGGFCCENGYEGNARYPTENDIVVVKTHYPYYGTTNDLKPCLKIVRIVRHPVDSIYSLLVYNHEIITSNQKIPHEQLECLISSWRRFQEYWNNQKNVITIRYEDLYTNPYEEFSKITHAMGLDLEEKDIIRAIEKHPPRGGLNKHFDKFSFDDLQSIKEKLADLMLQFGYEINH